MKFSELVNDLISEARPQVEGVDYNSLSDKDQQRLTEAYIAEIDGFTETGEVMERLPDEWLRLTYSQMAGPDDNQCDVFDFRTMFRNAATKYYGPQIQDHIDDQFRDYCFSNGINSEVDAYREAS